jgi:L-glyceraldehyde reductase
MWTIKTSKLWNTQHHPEVVEAALDKCLKELDLDYLDQFLIHWPCAFKQTGNGGFDNYFPLVAGKNEPDGDVEMDDNVSIVDTWKAMLKLPKSKTRSVGVSNFSVEHLETIIEATGEVPSANQVERHPLLQQPELIEYCKKKNIHITAYSAFGNNFFGIPLLVTRPEVKDVAEKAGKRLGKTVTPAQVMWVPDSHCHVKSSLFADSVKSLAWSQVGGHSVIPKSVTPSRIAENFQEIELTDEEIKAVDALGKEPKRMNVPYTASKLSPSDRRVDVANACTVPQTHRAGMSIYSTIPPRSLLATRSFWRPRFDKLVSDWTQSAGRWKEVANCEPGENRRDREHVADAKSGAL